MNILFSSTFQNFNLISLISSVKNSLPRIIKKIFSNLTRLSNQIYNSLYTVSPARFYINKQEENKTRRKKKKEKKKTVIGLQSFPSKFRCNRCTHYEVQALIKLPNNSLVNEGGTRANNGADLSYLARDLNSSDERVKFRTKFTLIREFRSAN